MPLSVPAHVGALPAADGTADHHHHSFSLNTSFVPAQNSSWCRAAGTCIAGTCFDGVKNNAEKDIDWWVLLGVCHHAIAIALCTAWFHCSSVLSVLPAICHVALLPMMLGWLCAVVAALASSAKLENPARLMPTASARSVLVPLPLQVSPATCRRPVFLTWRLCLQPCAAVLLCSLTCTGQS